MAVAKTMNPFLYSEGVQVNIFNKKRKLAVQVENAEVVNESYRAPYMMDKHLATQVYRNGMAKELFYSLSSAALRVFNYVMFNLPKDQDIINMQYKKVLKEIEMSEPTYYKGVRELCDKSILAKKYAKDYWINPHLLFCGKRPQALVNLYGDDGVEVKAVVKSRS